MTPLLYYNKTHLSVMRFQNPDPVLQIGYLRPFLYELCPGLDREVYFVLNRSGVDVMTWLV